jgi:hypothetical protein
MNCDNCNQTIGLNDKYQWIPYQRTQNIRKKYEYICVNCYHDIYAFDDWKCDCCNKSYSSKTEFCYDEKTQYCVPCLIKKRETTNKKLYCVCRLCQDINNFKISLK